MVEDDPISFHQAMQSSNSQKWINAMNEEIKSMKDNDVWDLVPLLESAKPIGIRRAKRRGIRLVLLQKALLKGMH